jgi:hypothetical protein
MQKIRQEIVEGTLNKYKVIEVDHDRWITDIAKGYVGLQDGNNQIFYIINSEGRVERIVRDRNTMTSDLTIKELKFNLSISPVPRRYFLTTPENIVSKATRSYILTRIPRIQVINKDLNYNQFDRPVTFNEELV